MSIPPLPPPPYSDDNYGPVSTVETTMSPRASPHIHPPLQRKFSPICPDGIRSDSPQSVASDGKTSSPAYQNHDNGVPPLPPTSKFTYHIAFKKTYIMNICSKIF